MSGGLKNMKEHVKAVNNIKKITSTMKVVAAAKFTKHEKKLRLARPLGLGSNYFYERSNLNRELSAPDVTFFAVTSDRGLCGSMHAKVCRLLAANTKKLSHPFDIVCIGEKARGILTFDFGNSISLVVNGIGHTAPTFADASEIVIRTFRRDEFKKGYIIHPKFRSMLSFEVDQLVIYSLPIILSSKAILRYELESDELISYLEFSQASLMYYALSDTYLVELASRITAMSSASRNAGTMSQKLQLALNRKRQQMITTELNDIVSGAQCIRK